MGMTLCPGKYQPVASTGSWDRQLDVDLDDLVGMGTQRLVSLVTDDDMRVLRVETLGTDTPKQGHGMESPSNPRHHRTNAFLARGCITRSAGIGHVRPFR
jgi:hypothetical protein